MLKKILVIFCITFIFLNSKFAFADTTDELKEELNVGDIVFSLEEYTKDLDLNLQNVVDDLTQGKQIDYGIIGEFIFNKFFIELRQILKDILVILIVIILMAVIKSIQLEKSENISKIVDIIGFLIVVSIILKFYLDITKNFINTIGTLTNIMQIVAPFMLSMLIATGEVTTSGIIGPIILFVTSLIGTLVTNIIIPLLSVSLVFKVITSMSDIVKLEKISKLFEKTSLWIISIIFAIFLGILELQSSITTSVDSVMVKTSQTAISNLIPVVGKFVSDSLEVVFGASEVIGKSIGAIGIFVLILTASIPIIKLAIYSIIYFILSCISYSLDADKKITNLLENMSSQYKTMVGIMVGVTITFIIAIGIVIKLIGSITS